MTKVEIIEELEYLFEMWLRHGLNHDETSLALNNIFETCIPEKNKQKVFNKVYKRKES